MSRLSLVWDGAWLTWATFKDDAVGRREISRPDMVPEVLRALRNQVGVGAQVVFGEWGQAATVMPQALLVEAEREANLAQWHQLHHGALAPGHSIESASLDALPGAPWIAVAASRNWMDAVSAIFPQARHIPLTQALIHDAVTWNRSHPHDGWSFRVDVREEGGVLVAAQGEALQWIHHLAPGSQSEDALYAMVNAAHRSDAQVHDARVRWSGSPSMVRSWDRFLHVEDVDELRGEDNASTWKPLLHSLMACG